MKKQNSNKGNSNSMRVDDQIRSSRVVLIDSDGTNLGEVPANQARIRASEQGLNLIEVSAGTDRNGFPVCKIADYGKMRYEMSKNRKTTKKLGLKEMSFHLSTAEHDLDIKMNKVSKFLSKGHQVKVSIFLKGREKNFVDMARETLADALSKVEGISTNDGIKSSGNLVYTMLSPSSKTNKK